MKKSIIAVSILMLTACGGGSEDAATSVVEPAPAPITTQPAPAPEPTVRYVIDDAAVTDGTLPIFSAPHITKIDVDGDGLEDIISSGAIYNFDKHDLQFARNLGDGTYQMLPISDVVEGLPSVHSITTTFGKADFNNDGFDDLYMPTSGIDLEPWAGEQNILLLGSENGLVMAQEGSLPEILTFTHDYALGDFNNDGHMDILEVNACCGGYGVTILLNDGNAKFNYRPDLLPADVALDNTTHHPETSSLGGAVADFNNDGLDDIILSGRDTDIYGIAIYINDGGSFSHSSRYTVEPQFEIGIAPRVRAKDINNDGYPDVFVSYEVGNHVGNITVYVNNQDMTFTDETALRLPFQSTDSTKGYWTQNDIYFDDVNNDGNDDVWFHGTSNNEIAGPRVTHIWLNDGTGIYTKKDLTELNNAYQTWIDSGDAMYDENGTLNGSYKYAVTQSTEQFDMFYTPIFRDNGFTDYLMLQSWCVEAINDTCISNTRAILFKDQTGE